MSDFFNILNFLHFAISMFMVIFITTYLMYTTAYRYKTKIYLILSIFSTLSVGILKEVYDCTFKNPTSINTITDLLSDSIGVLFGVIVVLIIIKESDR